MTKDIINDLPKSHARLHWACRRGMLELDVLLGNFLNEAYDALTEAEKSQFADFLTYPDPDLMAWIMGRETPPNAVLAATAKRIHDHAKRRF